VRLPDEIIARVDALAADGAGSRAAVVMTAVERYFQPMLGERDARVLRETGD
jgi:predicted transcriptional regulator